MRTRACHALHLRPKARRARLERVLAPRVATSHTPFPPPFVPVICLRLEFMSRQTKQNKLAKLAELKRAREGGKRERSGRVRGAGSQSRDKAQEEGKVKA